MTVWVLRDGVLVDKASLEGDREPLRFPIPSVSRMEPFESPVTGKEISTWRQRQSDMDAVGAVDRRDYPKDHVFTKGRT